MDTLVSGRLTFAYPEAPIYFRGLSDVNCNDPLGDPYTDKPFTARNTDRAKFGAIPEVRKLENGDVCYLTEPVEFLWYYSWRLRVGSSLSESDGKNVWRKDMRGNAAFTNKAGSDTKHSWVLGTNVSASAMRSEGVDCPGWNLYRAVDGKTVIKNGRYCVAVWCLDYHYLKTLTVLQARELAIELPPWLLHVAKDVHPDGTVTNWDYDFRVPMMTSKETEMTAVVDGFPCRRNYMRLSRLLSL